MFTLPPLPNQETIQGRHRGQPCEVPTLPGHRTYAMPAAIAIPRTHATTVQRTRLEACPERRVESDQVPGREAQCPGQRHGHPASQVPNAALAATAVKAAPTATTISVASAPASHEPSQHGS